MENEIWLPIEGYNGRYEVSNFGRVKSNTQRPKILKRCFDKAGYTLHCLNKGGYMENGSMKTVHRLVAMAFIPNPNNLPEVNHIDCNKENNCVDNLEWADRFINMRHAYANGRMPDQTGLNHHASIQVRCVFNNSETIYDSIIEASLKTGADRNSVSRSIREGRPILTKKFKGYQFYVNPPHPNK